MVIPHVNSKTVESGHPIWIGDHGSVLDARALTHTADGTVGAKREVLKCGLLKS